MYWDDKYGTHSVSSDVNFLNYVVAFDVTEKFCFSNMHVMLNFFSNGTGYFKYESYDDGGLKQCC